MTARTSARRFAFLDHEGPIAFAHRGGAPGAEDPCLENTMPAFQRAIDLGYRYLETDVHTTADGVLLAFHDATLDRLTNRRGALARLSYQTVQQARIGGREPIPTLADVLQTWPDVRVNVDVKSVGAVVALARTLHDTKALERVCVASFSHARIRSVRRLLGPDVATAVSPLEVAALRLLPIPRLRSWLLRAPVPCVQVPTRVRGVPVVTPRFMTAAHRLGKHVHVWTVDDTQTMHRVLDLGADGIISNRIDSLRDVLVQRGQWRTAA